MAIRPFLILSKSKIIEKSFKKDFVKKAKSVQLIYEQSDEIEEAIKLFKHIYSKRFPNLAEKNYEDLVQLCILLKNKGQLLVRKINLFYTIP